MTLQEYIDKLQLFADANPNAVNLQVVYSTDSEGNNYEEVHYEPAALGVIEDGGFVEFEQLEECGYDYDDINAVCIN